MVDEVLSARLKELRKLAGLTQAQLAEKAGVSAKAIAQFEQGDRLPAWDSITKIADALGVSLDEFRQEPESAEKAPRGRPAKDQAPEHVGPAKSKPTKNKRRDRRAE